MTQLEIIGSTESTYVRTARIACSEKGVDYAINNDHIKEIADFQSPVHLALHPFGRIPVMRHEGFVLFETSAICRYVDASFDGPKLVPTERRQAALMEQWISACNDYVAPRVTRDFILKYAFPRTEDGKPDRKLIEENLPAVRDTLKILNAALEDGPYFLGQTPYIADFFLLPIIDYLAVTPEGPELLSAAPNVARFRQSFSQRPGYAATLPDRLKEAA